MLLASRTCDHFESPSEKVGSKRTKPAEFFQSSAAKKKLLAGQLEPATVAMCLEVGEGWHGPANTNATNATNANARSFFIAKTVARMLTQRW